MNAFDSALAVRQREDEARTETTRLILRRARHLTGLVNRVQKICPRHAKLEVIVSGGSHHVGLAIYIRDNKTLSPKDLISTFYKLEKFNGPLLSNISETGDQITYTSGKSRYVAGRTLYTSINYAWLRPDDSACQIIVTGQRETEGYELVKRKEPIFQVVCP